MISSKSFTREWLESFINPKAKKIIQPDLLEKMIHALALLEKLAQQNIDYIFKGGTCLTLLLESANRFSIDVDITTPVAEEKFEKVLDKIIKASHFASWTPDERENPLGIPKAHYLFEFDSVFNKDTKAYTQEEMTEYIDRFFNYHYLKQVFEVCGIEPDWKNLGANGEEIQRFQPNNLNN